MPKKAKELGALAVSRLDRRGLWAVGGVTGLYLQISESGARSWILRTTIAGKRRDMGLGGYPDVTLSGALAAARTAKESINSGTDPIESRRAAKSRLRADRESALTFEQASDAYIRANESGWKNSKHGQQWRNTLVTYAYPVVGSMLIRDMTTEHVLKILEPIWTTKTETATRLRGRIELVYSWAMAAGAAPGPNPAVWKDRLARLLPKPSRVTTVKHHAAIDYRQVSAFLQRLRSREGIAARALEFVILTAARSGEVRGARWEEIDLEKKLWTVPASRMKAGKEHRQPLSIAAMQLIEQLPRNGELLFPTSSGGALSDMALLQVMRRMSTKAVPHGFRSTFRDWAAECTNHPREVCELALAHEVGEAVELAYRRSDLLAKRVQLMEDWATFLAASPATKNPLSLATESKVGANNPAGNTTSKPTMAEEFRKSVLRRVNAPEEEKRIKDAKIASLSVAAESSVTASKSTEGSPSGPTMADRFRESIRRQIKAQEEQAIKKMAKQ